MKILHLVSGPISEGAARGAYWLHRGLVGLGVDSFLLNNSREQYQDVSVASLADTSARKIKSMLLPQLGGAPKYFYRKRKPWIFNTGFEGFDFTKHPHFEAADVIHLHWINGLVAMRTLRKIGKPIIWTLRDMWPFTGGCHYSMECNRYELGCGQCPQLGSSYTRDLSRLVVSNKRRSLPKDMRIVGVSDWLSDCARRSTLFQEFQIQTISNNIHSEEYFPVESEKARDVLGLPKNKKIVLIGAKSVDDFYKGFDLLIAALSQVKTENIHVVLFGLSSPEIVASMPFPLTELGFLSDTISLRLAYSAADVFIAPSRMDAFPKTPAESMACGTPVVCFDATGLADIVEHKVTGIKATPFDALDLARGVDWVLSLSPTRQQQIRAQSRERAKSQFDSKVIAAQYLKVYEEMLTERQSQ